MKKKIICLLTFIAVLTCSVFALTACNKTGTYTPVDAQATIFTELNAKTADVGILDYTMAKYLLSTDSSLANNVQMIDGVEFDAENYGIAFRKGSGKLCDIVNQALAAMKTDGSIATIANKYGLGDNVLALTYTAKTSYTADEETDWNYLVGKSNKEFVIGYTLNPPMAIKNETTGDLSGFDIELPRAVIAYINENFGTDFTVKFQLIEWGQKETELSSKAIDCIWNGMTITEERQANMTISIPYLLNKQVALIRKADAKKYADAESLKTARIVAEDGSAGEDVAKKLLGID